MIKPEKYSKWVPPLIRFVFPFVFFTIYFRLFADHIFHFQEKSILFQISPGYFMESLHQPGKLLIWLSELFTSFFYYPFAGSLLVSAILCLIMAEIKGILRILSGKEMWFIPFLTVALLFFLQTNYQYLVLNTLGLWMQVLFFHLTVRYLKNWFPVVTAPLWYFICGGFSWLYFLLVSLFYMTEKRKSGWIRIVILWVVCLLLIYISQEFLFFQSVKTLLLFPFSPEKTGSQTILFLITTVIIGILPLIARVQIRSPFKKLPRYFPEFASSGLFIAALFSIAFLCTDKKTNRYFQVEKLFMEGKIDEVIAFNTRYPSNNILTNYLNNIALCEKGQLNDRLFQFRQSPDGQTLFLKWEILGEILRHGGYFYYTTGMINEAQRWAYEYMVMRGLTPEGLRMLVKTELINGNPKVASKYVSILKKSMFYRKEARKYEHMLDNEKAVEADPELGARRRERVKTDFFTITDNPVANIERILLSDSLNRNVFQYKIAWLLLKKDFQGIVKELPRFPGHGYHKIPVHVQEAVFAYLSFNKENGFSLPGNLTLGRETETRFRYYMTTLQQNNNDLRKAEPALKRQFGDTFWYYAFYQ